MNIDKQKMLLDQIRAYAFSVNDLALYLDTHPCDARALRYQKEYSEKLTKELGKGYKVSTLRKIRQFYLLFRYLSCFFL